MSQAILFKIPSRERPAIFEKCVRGWLARQSRSDSTHYLVSLDANDPTLPQYLQAIKGLWACHPHAPIDVHVGESKNKIDAVNRDLDKAPEGWSVIICGSDDMECAALRWDVTVVTLMRKHFPKLDGALHFPDGNTKDLITFTVMGARLYRAFGYLYHPDYASLWADNEFHDTVYAMGKVRALSHMLARHRHCSVRGGLPKDKLYERNEALYGADNLVYLRRKVHNFDIDRVRADLAKG